MRLTNDAFRTILAALADEEFPPLANAPGDTIVAVCARGVTARDFAVIDGCPVVAFDVLGEDNFDAIVATWADVLGVPRENLYAEAAEIA
jgi:hypothetical protein